MSRKLKNYQTFLQFWYIDIAMPRLLNEDDGDIDLYKAHTGKLAAISLTIIQRKALLQYYLAIMI